MSNYITQYWDRVNALPSPAQDIVLKYWDETGRSIVDHIETVIVEILSHCNTYDDFVALYNEVFPERDEEDLITCWSIYIGGMNRLREELHK